MENEPGNEIHKEEKESKISIEVSSDSLPFVPKEACDNWMLQQMPVFLALGHVPSENKYVNCLACNWPFSLVLLREVDNVL